jgi:hypothetical protein
MVKMRITPEARIHGAADALAQTEHRLDLAGLPVGLLEEWLTRQLHLRELRARHAAGALETLEYESEGDND